MRFRKQLLGFVVFVAVFSSILGVYEYLYGPLGFGPFMWERPAETPAPVAEPAAEQPATAYDVRLVSLDFISGKAYTTLALKREAGRPVPEAIRVETSFYVGERKDELWTTTTEIDRPFDVGSEVEVTAAADCYWCARPDAPEAGYFADVRVSARYPGTAYLPTRPLSPPPGAAFPVVVQAERKSRR